jgi:large subunit ribosomal protein L10
MSGVRAELRKNNATLKVIKNTLATRASEGTSFAPMVAHLKGPTSIIFSEGEVVDVAKTVISLDKKLEKFGIKVAVLEGKVLDTDKIKALSQLPSKEVQLSILLGTLNAPITGLARSLNQTITKLAYALNAVAEQKQA